MEEAIDLDDKRVADAFNEWMRRYIDHPEQFAREWQTVSNFLNEANAGQEPSYGQVSVAYIRKIIAEN
jgi:hypothetical protein